MSAQIARLAEQSASPLLPHQARALGQIMLRPAAHAVFLPPGTGKTRIAIAHAEWLAQAERIEIALVVAPKGVHRQWAVQQVPLHAELMPDVGWWDGRRFVESSAGGPNSLRWLCANYDAFRSKAFKRAISDVMLAGVCKPRFLLIADESHYIKNPSTARAKAMIKLARLPECGSRLALTGTPVTATLEDLWGQFQFLDPQIIWCKYKTAFRRRYCVMGGYENREIVDYRDLEELYARTGPYIVTMEDDELAQLPDEYVDWEFELLPEQRRAIRQAKSDILIDLEAGRIDNISLAIQRIAKIQQISNGWAMGDDGVPLDVVPTAQNPRLVAMQEWLGDTDLGHHPVAIWARYRHDIALIAEALRGNPVYQYHGGTSAKERAANLEAWLAEGGVFLGTPGAGGVGLNLQGKCQRVLYWSQSENYAERVQSEARFSRIGKSGPVEFTTLVARGSRDLMIQKILGRKDNLFKHTMKGLRDELSED